MLKSAKKADVIKAKVQLLEDLHNQVFLERSKQVIFTQAIYCSYFLLILHNMNTSQALDHIPEIFLLVSLKVDFLFNLA